MKNKVCIIVANFYPQISKKLIEGAIIRLKKNKFTEIKVKIVPGIFEIPVVLSKLIKKFDGFIVLGCAIKGKTPHFHFLCSSVFQSILNLSINFNKPIGNGILTCNNKKQAVDRSDIKKIDKGGGAAEAIISVLKINGK